MRGSTRTAVIVTIAMVAVTHMATVSEAAACTVDGKPSAYANGVGAVLVKTAPTAQTYAWWARFAFSTPFHAGKTITFYENDAQVKPILPLADFSRSWRWSFGDGSTAVGDRAAHQYAHAGRYKMQVEAYFSRQGWLAFDTITVIIRS